MTFRVAFWWGIFSVLCLVFVEAVSRPVSDDKCRIVKQGHCSCQCVQTRSTTWESIASVYKRLFIRSFAPLDSQTECSNCEAECKRYIAVNCMNGVCHENGCECEACWTGKNCDQPANVNAPHFKQDFYKAQISDNAEPGSIVVKTIATDKDSNQCSKNAPCPCGQIMFYISNGNEAGYFIIEQQTGVLRVAKNLESSSPTTFVINVVAVNEDGKRSSTTKVSIDVVKKHGRERRSAEHHIVRRSAPTPSPSGIISISPIIKNNTFYKPNDKIRFNLTASHNQSVTEAKPTSQLNFRCSSVFLSVMSQPNPAGPAVSNWAVNNGELTFTVATLSKSEVLNFEFDVEVKSNIHPLANLYLNCEATTAMYKIGAVASTPTLYAVFPKVTLTRRTNPEDSLISVDTTLQYEMTIEMPHLDFPLFVELTSAINDFSFMRIHDVQVTKGSDIGAGVGGIENPTPQYHKSSNELTFNDRATLDFKNLTVSAGSDNKIVIQWKVDMNDHPLVVNGSKYWNGAGLSSGSNMLHVAQQAVYAKKIQPAVSCSITPKNNTITNRFSIDDIISFDFECGHTNTSTANAKNVTLKFYSTYLEFMSASYTPPGGSANIVSTYNSTSLNGIIVESFTLGQLTITGSLNMKVKDNMYPLVELNVYVKVGYQNEAGKNKMKTVHKPKQPAIAAVPIISLNITNPLSCYRVGSVIDMEFKILMRKINSPLRIEMIAPVNTSSPVIAITSVSTPVIGSNIIDYASLVNKPINCRSTVNDTSLNDRCTIDFGTVKSTVGIVNSPLNEISIKFKVLLTDHSIIKNGSKYWPAIGVRGGSRMMWIGEVAIKVCLSADPKPVLKIESNCYVPGTAQTCCNGKLKKNDEVQYNITVSHDNQLSEQYADKIKIIHMLPPYVVYDREILKNPRRLVYTVGPQLTNSQPLRFLDQLSFSYIAKLDPEGKVPPGDTQATSIAEVSYIGHDVNKVYSRNTGVCCAYSSPSDPSSGKPSVESSPLPEWYNRGFVLISTSQTLIVCSENVASTSCFYTSDGGASWRAMNEQVGRVIGQVGEVLYAISSNKRAYLKQVKRDDNWYAITESEWKGVKSSASTNLKTIPDSEVNEADPSKVLEDGSSNGYGGNKIGVYFRSGSSGPWTKKAIWKCCGAL